jgi:hypothetical membrane protein
MSRRNLVTAGAVGIAAVALYVGTTILGGVLDPQYSHVRNAVSELTGSTAPDRALLAPLYIGYNLVMLGFGYALFRAAGSGILFPVAVVLFTIAALSGIGQVTVFRMDSIGDTPSTAGAGHLVLAGVSSLLCLAIAILYGIAFRGVPALRRLSRYSFATAAGLVLTAPLAVGSIGTDVMGLFERITIGVFMLWIVVVSAGCLLAARGTDVPVKRAGSAPVAA